MVIFRCYGWNNNNIDSKFSYVYVKCDGSISSFRDLQAKRVLARVHHSKVIEYYYYNSSAYLVFFACIARRPMAFLPQLNSTLAEWFSIGIILALATCISLLESHEEHFRLHEKKILTAVLQFSFFGSYSKFQSDDIECSCCILTIDLAF